MNHIIGETHRLRYNPFPYGDKQKKEYVIGEALLRSKAISDEELATLRNVSSDPPDLIVETKEFGEIGIEITESVPYDRTSVANANDFIRTLRSHLDQLGTRPSRPANLHVYREPFAFPVIPTKEIKRIAEQIDSFFASKDFTTRYEIIQDVIKSPIRITCVPALGTFALPTEYYHNNLRISDITGYPVGGEGQDDAFGQIVQKKARTAAVADILVIFHGIVGILGSHEPSLRQLMQLPHKGIYIIGILQLDVDYWINVVTIREHPIFEQNE